MNQNEASARPRRKRINTSQVVEIQIGVQKRRYEPVQYNSQKASQPGKSL
jgi:hypothetical protein